MSADTSSSVGVQAQASKKKPSQEKEDQEVRRSDTGPSGGKPSRERTRSHESEHQTPRAMPISTNIQLCTNDPLGLEKPTGAIDE